MVFRMKTKQRQRYAIFTGDDDAVKTSLLWDEDTDAWVYISGQPVRQEDPRNYVKIIPTMYRAVDKRAKAVSNMPFALMKGEEDFDTSGEWENNIKLIPSMRNLLYVIEASLSLTGRAYCKQEDNQAGYKRLIRHLDPTSVTLDETKLKSGEIVFKREQKTYTPKEILYFWYPDPYVEIGPPASCPAGTALNACGVLANVDEFAKKYFARGAIKAMLFAAQGMPKDQAEMFESWWNKFISGIQNAFRTKVINAEKVTPVVVGEGIKELEDTTLTQEKREEIATAFDIPFAILFSNAANYATAVQDKKNWYDDSIVPECNWIADVLNEQLFVPMGYHFEFRPETLDIMQEDEAERAGALKQLTDAGLPLLMAMDILGYEMSDEDRAKLEAMEKEPEPVPPQLVAPIAQPGESIPLEGNRNDAETSDTPSNADVSNVPQKGLEAALTRELSIWQSKCLKAVKRGEAADSISFVPVNIPAEMFEQITAGLKDAQDADAVKAAFANATVGEAIQTQTPAPEFAPWQMTLVAELKRANDLLEATAAVPAPSVTHESMTFNFPTTKLEITQAAQLPQPAPIVNVTNEVNPTPVTVEVTNEVNPAAVSIDNKVEIPAASNEPNMRLKVERDNRGMITRVVEE
jgi:hypothetical protein